MLDYHANCQNILGSSGYNKQVADFVGRNIQARPGDAPGIDRHKDPVYDIGNLFRVSRLDFKDAVAGRLACGRVELLYELVYLFDLIQLTCDNQAVGCLVGDDFGLGQVILSVTILHQGGEQLVDHRGDLGDFSSAQLENPKLHRFYPVSRVQFSNHRSCRRH